LTRGVSQSPVRAMARAEAANSGGVSSTRPVLPTRHTNSANPTSNTASSTSQGRRSNGAARSLMVRRSVTGGSGRR